jgi:hypothetical protein
MKKYAPKKISFVGEENFIFLPNKTKRYFISSSKRNAAGVGVATETICPQGQVPCANNPNVCYDPAVDYVKDPCGIIKPVDYAIDIPLWDSLNCTELKQAMLDFQNSMMTIKNQDVLAIYTKEMYYAEDLYTKKCTGVVLICAEGEVMQEVTECPECTKLNPPCSSPCTLVKKCVPVSTGGGGTGGGGTGGGGTGTGGGGTEVIVIGGGGTRFPPIGTGFQSGGGGGGGEKETPSAPNWLWLILVAAGVYVLAKKD